MIDQRDVALVRESFRKILPIKRMAAELFYARLFTIAPEVEPLFKGDIDAQAEKLMATLQAIVAGLDDFDALRPVAEDLAARHVTYGVTPRHYEPVGDALLFTLSKGLEAAFTPEVEAAWSRAYGALSEAMVASAYPKADGSSAVAAE